MTRAAAGRRHAMTAHLAAAAALFALQFVLPPFHHGMVARIMVFAAYAVGYNLLLGYTGLMSLGHAMFFAAGMYGTGLTVYYRGFGPGEAFLAGLLGSLLLATVIGWITLRTSGVSFLIVTMMFAQVFFLSMLYFNRFTGGDQGFTLSGRLAPFAVAGFAAPFSDPAVKYNLAFLVLVAAVAGTLWLLRTPIGRVLIAIRENDERTRMLGYDTFRYKWFALVVSGTVSGAAGSIYTLLFSYVGASFASILYSIYPLLWTLLGGVGTVPGPLIGAGLVTYLVDFASEHTRGHLIVVGAALVLIILRFPAGIMGGIRARWWPWLP
jgi:branched-chain amino acid transport system permease protein